MSFVLKIGGELLDLEKTRLKDTPLAKLDIRKYISDLKDVLGPALKKGFEGVAKVTDVNVAVDQSYLKLYGLDFLILSFKIKPAYTVDFDLVVREWKSVIEKGHISKDRIALIPWESTRRYIEHSRRLNYNTIFFELFRVEQFSEELLVRGGEEKIPLLSLRLNGDVIEFFFIFNFAKVFPDIVDHFLKLFGFKETDILFKPIAAVLEEYKAVDGIIAHDPERNYNKIISFINAVKNLKNATEVAKESRANSALLSKVKELLPMLDKGVVGGASQVIPDYITFLEQEYNHRSERL